MTDDRQPEPAHARITGDDRDLRDYTPGQLGIAETDSRTRAFWPASAAPVDAETTGDRL